MIYVTKLLGIADITLIMLLLNINLFKRMNVIARKSSIYNILVLSFLLFAVFQSFMLVGIAATILNA